MSGQLEHLLVSGICVVIDIILTLLRSHRSCPLAVCRRDIRHTSEYGEVEMCDKKSFEIGNGKYLGHRDD
jgi:hypothetical protein